MTHQPDTPILPCVEENDASPEVAHVFNEAMRITQSPFVSNFFKCAAPWLPAAEPNLEITKTMVEKTTLPLALITIIGYVIATNSDCEYCAVGNEIGCRTLGIDDETLDVPIRDLDNVSPERLRPVVAFALKKAKSPQLLEPADYEAMREYGVTDEEIMQIVTISPISVFSDIMADGLKITVEDPKYEALETLRGS